MSDSTENSCCGCHADEKRAARDPGYRRALRIVVLLNFGFGFVELIGGFLARSQALKADSLDQEPLHGRCEGLWEQRRPAASRFRRREGDFGSVFARIGRNYFSSRPLSFLLLA